MNKLSRGLKWQTNIHTIELKLFLNAISKDFESFKAEIEKRRNKFETEIDNVFPISPTECMNSPNGISCVDTYVWGIPSCFINLPHLYISNSKLYCRASLYIHILYIVII